MAVIPMLLNNAETWVDISAKTVQELEKLQLMFYRNLFAVGSGCPFPSLLWETGGILMKYRLIKKKFIFLHHVATLPDGSLAKEVLDIQKKLKLPECQE